METKTKIEGTKPTRTLLNVNIGNGWASYAQVDGQWYSVNMNGDTIQDVRWTASTRERDQIVALLVLRHRTPHPHENCDCMDCRPWTY